MSHKQEPITPFFQARNAFVPSLDLFVSVATSLYNTADLLCSEGSDFPGRDQLRKRVDEFRQAVMSEED